MKKLIINLGLFFLAIFAMFSGLLIQIEYHIGNHSGNPIDKNVLGLGYLDWSFFHKYFIVILTVSVSIHFSFHWKWYKTVISKRFVSKNMQVLTLTVIFASVTITGIIPWVIDISDGNQISRKAFIELHDKIAIFLSIYFILHILKRLKWFISVFEKRLKHGTQSSKRPIDENPNTQC